MKMELRKAFKGTDIPYEFKVKYKYPLMNEYRQQEINRYTKAQKPENTITKFP